MSEEAVKETEKEEEPQKDPYIHIQIINNGAQTQFETNISNLIVGLGVLESSKDFLKASIAQKMANRKRIIPGRHGILDYLRGDGHGRHG